MFEVPQQDNLLIKLDCNSIHDATIARAEITEKIHDLFSANLFLRTNKPQNLAQILNQTATVIIHGQDEVLRYFHGIIDNASIEAVPKANITENLLFIHIVPTITRLTYSRNYHIWLDKSVREIIEEILKNNNISDYKFTASKYNNKKLNMCVQYGESDLHFICRLLEENGIFYYIKHANNADTFVMSDSSIAGDKLANFLSTVNVHSQELYPLTGSQNVSVSSSITLGAVQYKAYNYLTTNVINGQYKHSDRKCYGSNCFYDNVYDTVSEGNMLCQILLESVNAFAQKLSAVSYYPSLYPGAIVTLDDKEYFVLSVKHAINQLADIPDTPIYRNSFEAIPRETVFRPINTHQKVRIWGCQTAVVIGNEENDKEKEVYCDESGRVKVQFHWASNNEISCWVRVGSSWAGMNFGSLVIPRVGMEVIVSFVNGDPDQPLITGCVYNGMHIPPAMYPLQKTVSTFYTKSVGGTGFNELKFNDSNENEEIYIHAQKDLNKIVENSISETLNEGSKTVTLESKKGEVKHALIIKKGDKTTLLDDGNSTITLKKGNSIISLDEGDSTITLKNGKSEITLSNGDGAITLENGNQKITLSNGDLTIKVNGTITIESSKDFEIKADGSIKIEAGQDIEVKTTTGKYSLSALKVNINASTALEAKSNMTMELNSSTVMNLKSAMINLN